MAIGEFMEPVTELDERFSDPGATATDWHEVRDALASAQLFWVTTVRRDRRPHMTRSWPCGSTTPFSSAPGPRNKKRSTFVTIKR